MRFKSPNLNERRKVTRFAWLPITINGETRWLETVTYIKEWYAPGGCWQWELQEFVD